MPKIRLKPRSAEYDDGRKLTGRHCDMPGCTGTAEYKAPRDRDLGDYYQFCLDHVREYNQAWNYFSGMSDSQVQAEMTNSIYGERPTWRYDTQGAADDILRRRAWQTYQFTDKEPPGRKSTDTQEIKQTPEQEALTIMGLMPPVTLDDIKARYKELAKLHHPDRNRGCKDSENLLKSINMAYTILKMAYRKFEILPNRTS